MMTVAYTEAEAVSSTPKRHGLLDSLPNRQRTTGEAAAARSVIVRRLRIALPVLALVLIGALFLNTRTNVSENAFLDDFANLDARPEQLRMANPRFAGVDDKGFPYAVTAEAALQSPGAQEAVELVRPRAVTGGDDDSTVVSANKGVFQPKQRVLELNDGVTLKHQIGGDTYTLRTDAAVISIGDETVQTTGAVEGEGSAGTLRADSMRAVNNEGRLVFQGNVSMRIYPDKAKAIEKPADGEEGGPP